MENYYKYLPISEEDENWGMHVLSTGYTHIERTQNYPSQNHPSPYYFNWKTGRILQEYQLIYISRGEGNFESTSAGKKQVKAGDVILLFPGDRHSYKPNELSGWDEYWVGFNGIIFDRQVENRFFVSQEPIFSLGIHQDIKSMFETIIREARFEKPAYQQVISGMLLQLLGSIYSKKKQSYFEDNDKIPDIIERATLFFRENITQDISPKSAACQLGIGYSWFRKVFKNYTGIAPGQYLIQLKIEKAKQLLENSPKSVKEIAYELNFESGFYFSKLFKQKTGTSPQQYRNLLKI